MSILSAPTCLRDLSETICLIAVSPQTWGLDDKGNLTKSTKGDLRDFSEMFHQAVSLFEHFYGDAEQPSKDALRCLQGLQVIAAHEATGAATKIIDSLAQVRLNHVRPNHGSVKDLDVRQCQVILSALWCERDLVKNEQITFSVRRRLNELLQSLESQQPPGCQKVMKHRGCVRIAKESSGYLVSTIIKHSTSTGGDELGSSSRSQVVNICKELRSLQTQGLLNTYDLDYLKKIEIIVQCYKYDEFFSTNNQSIGIKGLHFLSIHPDYMEGLREASAGKRFAECAFKLMKTGEQDSQEKSGANGVEMIQDSLFSYLDQQIAAEARYTEVYQRLRDKTRSISQIHYRKLLHDSNIPLTGPAQFTYTWKLANQKRQISHTSKSQGMKEREKRPKKRRVDEEKESVTVVSPKTPSQKDSEKHTPESKLSTSIEESKSSDKVSTEIFEYTDRVLKFMSPEQQEPSANAVEHGFAIAVDGFVKKMGIETFWKERDILYSIPGEIEYNGKVHRGIYTYCFDGNVPNRCYHRCFMRKPADQMVAEYLKKGYWEFDYPELKPEGSRKRKKGQVLKDGSHVVKENKHVIEISDPRNEATIRLFRVR